MSLILYVLNVAGGYAIIVVRVIAINLDPFINYRGYKLSSTELFISKIEQVRG